MVIEPPLSSKWPLATNSLPWEDDLVDLSSSILARIIFSSCLKIFSILEDTISLWESDKVK